MQLVKKRDFLIILAVLALVACLWLVFPRAEGQMAVIYYQNTEVKRVALFDGVNEDFTVNTHPNITFSKDGRGGVRFQSSDCPDKVCVNKGRLSEKGDSAVCLPNKLVLSIER